MARPVAASNYLGDAAATMTAAGTTAATAATVTADHVIVTVSTTTNRGVLLRALNAGEIGSVANADSTEPVYVYPNSGAQFNGQTADLHVLLPAGKSCIFIFVSATQIIANVSA